MTEIMTPSEKQMTAEQITKAVANYRAMLEKYAPNYAAAAVQQVLGMPELAKKQHEIFRSFVEAVSKTVVRATIVDRTRTAKESIAATNRVQYLNDNVLATMPLGCGDIEAIFVNLGRDVPCNKLDEELSKLGFELIVDPQGLASINEADSAFADNHPNGTQWKNAAGQYCFAIFDAWHDERSVHVDRRDGSWDDGWWFPCRRKSVLGT